VELVVLELIQKALVAAEPEVIEHHLSLYHQTQQ
jgi:hypothetical protein